MPFGLPPESVALAVFVVGVVLVVVSVEAFIEAVAESAIGLGVSGFFLTVVLAGTDLENAVVGFAAVTGGLPDLALGTVFGEALFVLCPAVGLAGVLTPFETRVPRSYLVVTLVAPVLLFALALDGTLSRFDGAVLTFAFLPGLGVVYALERNRHTRYLSAEEVEEALETHPDEEPEEDSLRGRYAGVHRLGVALVGVIGMTAGSQLAVTGARDLLSVLGITGLAFGATVVSFIASLEELFLTVEPVRRGRPHIGVGNVVGSVLFFVTANAGVVALVRPIQMDNAVFWVQFPFLIVSLLFVGLVFWRGSVGRMDGVVLLGIYVAYWGANYLL